MGSTENDAALAIVRTTSVPIHHIGTAIYLSPDVFGWAAGWGWPNAFAFYFAGRGGMLGDVDANVVCSAFGWFEPAIVKTLFDEGAAVASLGMRWRAPMQPRNGWPRPTPCGARSTWPTSRASIRSSR